ncbi:HAD family hydrolase [Porcipelethomonas sp.]|uniref:HAD family hydrolase n=1 Tax=Porcipelethomonas sp. TaxID=2981675 RepID=UPI003EF2723A
MKLAIFDLDGTLIDSLADIAEATNYAMRKLNLPEHALSEFNYLVGDGVAKLIERALPEDSQDKFSSALDLYNYYYNNNYTVKTYVYNDIKETLNTLKKNGVELAVASNKTHGFTENIINHYFGDELFSAVFGKSEGRPVKPDPAIVMAVMDKLNISAEDTVMIGDTCIDIKTGKNAGIKTIGCLWGFRTLEELVSAGADYIADKPSDIIKFVCG